MPYAQAVAMSAQRLRHWNPVDPSDLRHHIRNQSERHRTFLIRAQRPHGPHGIVGKVNVTSIVRGRSLSGTLGYDSYDPYAGRGLFTEGLGLIVSIAFAPTPHGLGLHRLEACVQPGNLASAGALRRLGFTARGQWPRYLWLADSDGVEAWRDHIVYGITREEWPAAPYAHPAGGTGVCTPMVFVLCDRAEEASPDTPGIPTPPGHVVESHTRARRLAAELRVPLIRDLVGSPGHVDSTELAGRLADALTGAVVLSSRSAQEISQVLAVAQTCGVRVSSVRIWPASALADDRALVRVALDALAAGAARPH